MTVDKLGDNKLLIKLDESDMENFELDFGKMSFENEDKSKGDYRTYATCLLQGGA